MKMSHQSGGLLPATRRGDPAGHVRLSVSERRQYRRDAPLLQTTLRINDEAYSAELLDISTGGARVRCSVVPKAGAEIIIGLEGFGDLPAQVVRRLPSAVAVEFKLAPLQYAEFSERLDQIVKAHS
jgi:PilZ domain